MESLLRFWFHVSSNRALQIFVISTLVLLFGLFLKALQVVRSTRNAQASAPQVQSVLAGGVALSHAYVPTVRLLMITFFSCIALLVSMLQTVRGLPPFDGPYESLYLVALFILTGTLGVLGELKWEHGKDYPFAFLIGTAMAFIFLGLKFSIPASIISQIVAFTIVLLMSIALAWKFFFPLWTDRAKALSIVSFVFWLVLYMPVRS